MAVRVCKSVKNAIVVVILIVVILKLVTIKKFENLKGASNSLPKDYRSYYSRKKWISTVPSVRETNYNSIHLRENNHNLTELRETNHNLTELRETNHNSVELEHWAPDWYNTGNNSEDMEAMLIARRVNIQKRCNSLPGYTAPKREGVYKGEIWRSKRLSYCATYKAGYTFWKVFFLKEERNASLRPKYPSTKKKLVFTVTRNPWHRLVSCWHDRFTLKEPLRSGFMRRMCNNKTWPSLPPFREFIEHCVVALYKLKKPPNFHWMPTIDRCHLCGERKITYDYILSQENMDREAIHVLTTHAGYKSNLSEYFQQLHQQVLRPGEGSFSNNYQDYYKDISKEHMDILKDLYKYELILFNYPKTPFVDFAKS